MGVRTAMMERFMMAGAGGTVVMVVGVPVGMVGRRRRVDSRRRVGGLLSDGERPVPSAAGRQDEESHADHEQARPSTGSKFAQPSHLHGKSYKFDSIGKQPGLSRSFSSSRRVPLQAGVRPVRVHAEHEPARRGGREGKHGNDKDGGQKTFHGRNLISTL